MHPLQHMSVIVYFWNFFSKRQLIAYADYWRNAWTKTQTLTPRSWRICAPFSAWILPLPLKWLPPFPATQVEHDSSSLFILWIVVRVVLSFNSLTTSTCTCIFNHECDILIALIQIRIHSFIYFLADECEVKCDSNIGIITLTKQQKVSLH